MPSEKRVALVTGGAKRVGRAIVEQLASAGFDVAFTHLNSAPPPIGAMAIRADLTDLVQTEGVARQTIERFGRLDVLVNSASIYEVSSLARTNPAQIKRLNAIHIQAPLLLCQRLETNLRAARGHVVNM